MERYRIVKNVGRKMISVERAEKLAQAKVEEGDPDTILILHKTVEFDDGWFFYFTSKRYLETGNILDRVIGLGPIIVGKENGEVYEAGSAFDEKYWIEKFKEYIQKNR